MITCVDAGPAQDYPLERFKGLTILSPNETETEALVGILPKDDETCIAARKILKERSDCKYVVLKMGDKGSFIYGDDICQMVPTFKVEAVDTTAAGDCFTGVLVKQYAETKDIVASARYASAAAAISVQHLGAQPSLPTKEAIDEFIAARSQFKQTLSKREEKGYPIFVTLSLRVECSLIGSHSILALRPQIQAIVSMGELSMAVEVKSDFMLEGLEDLSAGCRFTGNEILKIDI